MKRLLLLTAMCMLAAVTVPAAEIHDACSSGDLDRVEALLSDDATLLDARSERNELPIHVGAIGGHIEIVRLLLESGAPIDAGDNENSTALDIAAIFDHGELARFLVGEGADPSHRDDNGMTPLHFACYNGNAGVAEFLIAEGADVAATTNSRSTPLHGAGYSGHVECIALLLGRGAPVHARNAAGYTPVLSASAGTAGVEAVELLVANGADVHDRNYEGDGILMMAARAGKQDVVEYLIDAGVSMEARNNFGWTVLLSSVEGGLTELVTFLLENGADPNTADAYGRRAVWWAAVRGATEIAALLIEHGADVTVEAPDGMTALMRAMNGGHYELSELLLENGVPVDAVDPDMGRTVLHGAALKGWADFARLFIEHDADLGVEDAYGMTALDYAWKYGHDDVADLLESSGGVAAGRKSDYAGSPLADRNVASGESALWYLGHCGWAIKTENHLLIFDYWNGAGPSPSRPCLRNGHIDPTEIEGENVYVFVTHEHGDHHDTIINEWSDSLDDLTYVFGFRPELTPAYRDTTYNGPEYEYVGPREYREIDDLRIRTIAANDAGVGFLIEVDGLKLYHAGDHAGWADGERDGFFSEIDYLTPHADGLDLAFVNVTGCHAHDPERLLEGNVYTIEALRPSVLVPTHASDREFVYREAADELTEAGAVTEFCCAMNRGDSFYYNGEAVD